MLFYNTSTKCLLVLILFVFALLFTSCGSIEGDEQGNVESNYPEQDIEFIVPSAAGGGFDAWGRSLAPFIEKHLPGDDINVVVKNVSGAGQQIGTAELYRAKPDGYTMGIVNVPLLVAPQIISEESNYDMRELTYLGQVASEPAAVIVSNSVEANTIAELKEASSQGQPIIQAIPGFQPTSYIVADLFDIRYTPLQVDGQPETILALERNDAQMAVLVLSTTALEGFLGGTMKAILFVGEEKPEQGERGYEEFKDVQTIAEVGYPEFAQTMQTQYVLAAPPGLPSDIKKALEEAIQATFNDPEFIAQINENQMNLVALNARETTEVVNSVFKLYTEYENLLNRAIEEQSAGN